MHCLLKKMQIDSIAATRGAFGINGASIAGCITRLCRHEHSPTSTNAHGGTPVHTQTHKWMPSVIAKTLTALLKSVRKQMFGRMFSTGGTLLNKLHAEDQRCLSAWHTAETFSRVYSVKCTHLHICATRTGAHEAVTTPFCSPAATQRKLM